jgi:hypothetical protein
MPADSSAETEFEIGHVLFIDVVGYSKLPINKQRELFHQLNRLPIRSGIQSEAILVPSNCSPARNWSGRTSRCYA